MSKKSEGKIAIWLLNLLEEKSKDRTFRAFRGGMRLDSSMGSRQSMIQVDDTTRTGLSRAPRSGRVARCHYTYACV